MAPIFGLPRIAEPTLQIRDHERHTRQESDPAADSDGGWLQHCDPSHTGGEVPVWTSDQGFYPNERYVTYDLELVLRVVRYYAERGQLDSSVRWE